MHPGKSKVWNTSDLQKHNNLTGPVGHLFEGLFTEAAKAEKNKVSLQLIYTENSRFPDDRWKRRSTNSDSISPSFLLRAYACTFSHFQGKKRMISECAD